MRASAIVAVIAGVWATSAIASVKTACGDKAFSDVAVPDPYGATKEVIARMDSSKGKTP